MASGLAMLLGMMETKTPVLWQWGKAGRVKGRMEPAWAGGSGKFPAWGSQRQAWYISRQCSCLMALRFIDFTSNNKENIILDYHTQAKNVNKKQGPHPEEEVPQRGRSSHCFTDGEVSPRLARTNPTPASYRHGTIPAWTVVGWDKPWLQRVDALPLWDIHLCLNTLPIAHD